MKKFLPPLFLLLLALGNAAHGMNAKVRNISMLNALIEGEGEEAQLLFGELLTTMITVEGMAIDDELQKVHLLIAARNAQLRDEASRAHEAELRQRHLELAQNLATAWTKLTPLTLDDIRHKFMATHELTTLSSHQERLVAKMHKNIQLLAFNYFAYIKSRALIMGFMNANPDFCKKYEVSVDDVDGYLQAPGDHDADQVRTFYDLHATIMNAEDGALQGDDSEQKK